MSSGIFWNCAVKFVVCQWSQIHGSRFSTHVEKRNANGQGSQFGRLKDFGIDVKLDSNPYLMHHKVFVIDREIVITGSYNPTSAGAFRNDENIIIIHDREIAEKFIKEFEKVYAASG